MTTGLKLVDTRRNRARDKFNVKRKPLPRTRMDFLAKSSTTPSTEKEALPIEPANRRKGLSFIADAPFLNLLKNKMAFSRDESNFVLLAESFGIRTAIFLASKSHWKLQRPLRELLSAWNELAKSYTKRRAKTIRSTGRKLFFGKA